MDPRRLKSRLRLHAALRQMLGQMPLRDISVEALVRQAGVTRPTFYAHFTDVPEMLGEYLDHLLNEMSRRRCRDIASSEGDFPPLDSLGASIAGALRDLDPLDPRLQAILDGVPGLSPELRFAAMVQEMMENNVPALQTGLSPAARQLRAHFFTGAFVGLVRLWVSRKTEMTADELGEAFAGLVRNGAQGDHPCFRSET
ncbi:TetR/AcrR family transcriptional regulator [Allosediminivita pacifica]|uniref:TetR family transcriptional regulator n=1 Tax=Allosediminivita pacifica TaxID=1267769 RepID=A0A2T6A6I3_9RHOB|nr:TetR/AcrR family transcriptional regulator [Allosediminivita pacifica]PTX39395.1 TetR family transcriptional regulator [Allosediminivita pacifica]GGB28074.1 hypothetical protein GCM10011324_42220 [Allosediminivita pacifica]